MFIAGIQRHLGTGGTGSRDGELDLLRPFVPLDVPVLPCAVFRPAMDATLSSKGLCL